MRKPIQQPRNQKAHIVTSVPGPRSRALREREEKHLAPGLQGFALMAGIAIEDSRGSTVTDVDGNTFLDLIGGIGVGGLGHSHPSYVAALQAQVAKASIGSFTTEARVELFERIGENRPSPELHKLQLYSSGAEAVESALRLAKCHTGKTEFVSFWGGFHGKTLGCLALNGADLKVGMGPMAPGNYQIPYANPYRPPFKGLSGSSLVEACIDVGRKQLKANSCHDIAAFIIEPMQGTAGNVIPPDTFLPAVKELAREFGALLIVDEMITGFGRTGKYWGSHHSGVEADIVTLGKQFGGGFPMAGVLSKDPIVQAKPWSNPSGSSSSYGGYPMAGAAGAAALRIIDEEGLVENARVVGEYFLTKLQPLVDRYPFIGEVRGRGLMLGIEMVQDKVTKEPLSKAVCTRVFNEFLKRGLLTMAYASSFRIQPAMTIDEATVDNAVAILEEVYDVMKVEGWWRG